jgi:VIT1/CCC1 family predicted Fe2+/Mn2+ transporter
MNIARYNKFIVAAGAAIGMLGLALADGKGISGDEAWQIVLAIGAALGVYTVPNRPAS